MEGDDFDGVRGGPAMPRVGRTNAGPLSVKHSPLKEPRAWLSAPDGRVDTTVVMRTQDRPLLLRRAVGSVLQQTHRFWELIIVNDGGDPASVSEALSYWPNDSRIRVISNPEPLGMEAASNLGIDQGSGSYVVIHDDDDSWMPRFLEKTVGALRSPQGANWPGVVTWVNRVEEQVVGTSVRHLAETPFNHWQRHVSSYRMLASNTFPPICLVFRRECWNELEGFNERLPVLGDWDFHWRLLLLGDLGVVPETLARYHHRVTGAGSQGTYGNTVIAGVTRHQDYAVRYRNEWVREVSQQGQLPLLALLAEQTIGLHERITHLETILTASADSSADAPESASSGDRMRALEAAVETLESSVARSVAQLDSVLQDYHSYKDRMPGWLRKVARLNEAK